MAAKLEWWDDGELRLGRWTLARVAHVHGGWRFAIPDGGNGVSSPPNETREDCIQDCESEVRRLLKEAGVEVSP